MLVNIEILSAELSNTYKNIYAFEIKIDKQIDKSIIMNIEKKINGLKT